MKLKAVRTIPKPRSKSESRRGTYIKVLQEFYDSNMKQAQVQYEGEPTKRRADSVYTTLMSARRKAGLDSIQVIRRETDIYLAKTEEPVKVGK